MTLLAGDALDPKRFFENGKPQIQGSSFDLTIGHIFDHQGKRVEGPFTIEPGHMVQVVSAEQLILSESVTGHVTYKTTLTKQGIWALTVGIVDPGWHGPIATTLLNFSRVDHCVAEGDAFLRVSFFEHDPVPSEKLRKAPPLDAYLREIQRTAASRFPATFLNTKEIADAAGKNVLTRIRIEALGWVVGIALMFTLLQIVATWFTGSGRPAMSEIEDLRNRVETMQSRLVSSPVVSAPAPPFTIAPVGPAFGPPAIPSDAKTARPSTPPNSARH